MKNMFLCLLTNRWDVGEFTKWLEEGGSDAEHVVQSLYKINDEFYIDVRSLADMADEELELAGVYQGVMIDAAALSLEELEGLVSLGSILAFKEVEEEDRFPSLRLVKDEDKDE